MSIASNPQREEIDHLIHDDDALFQDQEFVEDPNTNYVTVSIEELQAAGIDIDNISELTEEQIQTLLSISQQNRRAQQQNFHGPHPGSHVVPKSEQLMSSNFDHFPGTSEAPRGHHQQRNLPGRRLATQPVATQPALMPSNTIASGPSTSQPAPEAPPNQITITITDEGHIKLTDAANQTFFFSREDLALRNIDAKNLTDKNIQDIIQVALPSLDVGRNHAPAAPTNALPPSHQHPLPPQKRRRIEPSGLPSEEPIFSHNMPHQNGAPPGPSLQPAPLQQPHRLPPTRGGSTLAQFMPTLQNINHRQQDSMLLGEEVEVSKNGGASMAIVRYCRPGAGYKVQYPDGHFEWVNETQITRRSGASPRQGKVVTRAGEVASPYRPASQPVQVAKKLGDVVGVGRRVPPPVPGIKLGPTSPLKHAGSSNFYCSVCDKHVCQQEPAYIILRLPACSTCAEEKIVILDEDDDDTESGRDENYLQHETEQSAPERQASQAEIRGIRVTAGEEHEPPSQPEPILPPSIDEHGFPANALSQEVNSPHGRDFQTASSQESHLQDPEDSIAHESFLETSDSFIGETLS